MLGLVNSLKRYAVNIFILILLINNPNTLFATGVFGHLRINAVLTLHVQTACLLQNLLAGQCDSAHFVEGRFAVFVLRWCVFGFNIPPLT
jgi:hypothetical protein